MEDDTIKRKKKKKIKRYKRKEGINQMACGRIRKQIKNGYTHLVGDELKHLNMGTIFLEAGQTHTISTLNREYAFVLIYGKCMVETESRIKGILGPRENPFEHPPYGLFASKEDTILFTAQTETFIGVGSAPAEKKTKSMIVTPKTSGGGSRGKSNWQRDVRFVCWSDNTEGNMLIAGETCTPSGNWSTIPPHRHQYFDKDFEVPYEEIYFFQFSKPQGFGLAWQFDDEGRMDQAFSLKTNDALYMDEGYHPTACAPGATLYHLTFICGPYRMSKSRVHKDFEFLLDDNDMENPYAKQFIK